MQTIVLVAGVLAGVCSVAWATQPEEAAPVITVTLPEAAASDTPSGPFTGRLLVMLSADTSPDATEPMNLVRDGVRTTQVFGMNVSDWSPGESIEFDTAELGYPIESFAELPAGDYTVQALLHKYERFDRADGHTVWLPMDRGEGQQWRGAPGNRYSTPIVARVAPGETVDLELDVLNPEIQIPPSTDNTKFIRRLRIRSELLSEFWGRDMYLGAVVLLPAGFDEHPDARYPLVINHGHFGETAFGEFRTSPPDENLEPEYSERFDLDGYNILQQQIAHDNYLEWTSEDFPRFLVLKIEHANPYYDDSYGVNSENLGPYGDAIMHELLPAVEQEFRAIGEGWARFTYGGSTGGWIALAAQVFYPDMLNGCFAACPDPVDFRAYTVVNLYEHSNAYFDEGPFVRVPRPGQRTGLGEVQATLEQVNQRELVLGTNSRSGDQWDIWEAVYSPVGNNGYPKPIWDKRTGAIDHDVALHWREHYDLSHIIERDWATLGPKLVGKMHLYVGTMDNYYLNNAVALLEQRLAGLSNPKPEALVDYACGSEHCWNGDHEQPNAVSRLRYHHMYVDRMLERMEQTAPAGADLTSWRHGSR